MPHTEALAGIPGAVVSYFLSPLFGKTEKQVSKEPVQHHGRSSDRGITGGATWLGGNRQPTTPCCA